MHGHRSGDLLTLAGIAAAGWKAEYGYGQMCRRSRPPTLGKGTDLSYHAWDYCVDPTSKAPQ